ncbi:RIP homotypic interaction motif-containing protein [Streptomyces sp. NPDC001914]|uniref:RIP homotypic interaction motif-containing protein n=1 Tax=Streptomyces sp. NPDC001914 TaxID=3364623 RepID=UPI0036B46560
MGKHNRQINVYTYRLEEPEVDFTELLEQEDVREALLKVIENPDDALLRRRAVNLLSGGRWRWHRQDVIELGSREPDEFTGEPVTDLYSIAGAGAVIISNCQDVQIGDHNVQRNKHLLVYRRSSVDTLELLRKTPKVAASLVDAVTSAQPEQAMEKLRRELTAALDSQPCEPEFVAERIQPDEPRSFVDEHGVSLDLLGTPSQRNVAYYETWLSGDDEMAERVRQFEEELHTALSRDTLSAERRPGISGPGLSL